MAYIWLGIVLIALVVEGMTAELVALWFAPAALICTLLAVLKIPLWVQVVVFLAVTVLGMLWVRSLIKQKALSKPAPATNADALIGKNAIVTEAIDNTQSLGAVRINGLVWSARAVQDGMRFAEGDGVTVYAIEGVKLIVIPKK